MSRNEKREVQNYQLIFLNAEKTFFYSFFLHIQKKQINHIFKKKKTFISVVFIELWCEHDETSLSIRLYTFVSDKEID